MPGAIDPALSNGACLLPTAVSTLMVSGSHTLHALKEDGHEADAVPSSHLL